MSVEIRVPTLGESIVEATISKWLKQEGDLIVAGEPLLELETDKVNLELPADQDGVLVTISKAEGETVQIGDVIGIIGEPGATSQHAVATTPQTPPPGEPPTAPPPVPPLLATPLAQRVAEEHAVDIRDVRGTGQGGRVTKGDVLSHIQHDDEQEAPPPPPPLPVAPVAPPAVPAVPAPPAPTPPPAAPPVALPSLFALPVASGEQREERVRMTRRRQTIAQRLLEAQHSAAMLTTFNEIDMSAVMDVRTRWRESFKQRHDVGLGFMSFFIKAVVGALKAFPLLNAEIQGSDIVIKHYYDIGVAVGTEQGLVVPVLREADRKTFAQIEQLVAELASRARMNELSLTDLQGGTFSITNGGIYGSLMSTPILNTPQVGILGMHKIEERPVVVKGEIVIRPMMYVALSYDHRIVDGSDAVRFLVRVKELVENPEALLLEG